MRIEDVYKKYSTKIDRLDLELLIASVINKSREFVLAYPEYPINSSKIKNLKLKIARRAKNEPLAYILGQKEFYGLNFKVNRHTLIPRPETEILVEKVLKLNPKNTTVIDVGTGSGNIIISLARNLRKGNTFLALDISKKALLVAKQNARLHKADNKIKFVTGSLLEPILKSKKYSAQPGSRQGGGKLQAEKLVVVANLPYLSKIIYASVSKDIKQYEPRSALLSGKNGLAHYEKLFRQIKKLQKSCFVFHISCFLEIGPEQKSALQKSLTGLFPEAKIAFFRDLAGRWRVCQIDP